MSSDITGKTVPTGRRVIHSKNHSIDTMLYRSLSSFCCRPGAGFRTTTGVHLHTGFKNVASLWPVCCPRPLETEAGEDGVPGNPLTASVLHKHVQLCRFSHGKKLLPGGIEKSSQSANLCRQTDDQHMITWINLCCHQWELNALFCTFNFKWTRRII